MRTRPVQLAALPREGTSRAWLAERSDGQRFHAGIDLGRAGDAVLAPEAGVVWGVIQASYADDVPRFSRPVGWAGYGPEVVVLEGDSGAWHVLAHVERASVRVGERVEAGAPVASVATRGNHLHWEVRSQTKPPRGWATVEVSLEPEAWLGGRVQQWSRALYGCPPSPADTTKTPRACRPSAGVVEPVPGRSEPVLRPPVLTPRARAPNPSQAPSRPRRLRGVGRDGATKTPV